MLNLSNKHTIGDSLARLSLRHNDTKDVPAMRIDEMVTRVTDHRDGLNPVDVTEKIERSLYVGNGNHTMRLRVGDETKYHDFDMQMLPVAWSDLCDRIKPAPNFRANMDALPAPIRNLAVNHFIQQRAVGKLGDRMQMFRIVAPDGFDPMLRTIRSHDYTPVDDAVILSILQESPFALEACIRRYDVEETRSSFNLVFPNREVDIQTAQRNEVVRAGVLFENSEVGRKSVSISGWVEVLSCTNGMKSMKQTTRFVHRGNRQSKIRMIVEAVRESLQESDELVEDMKRSTAHRLQRPMQTFDELATEYGWNSEFLSLAKSAFDHEPGSETVFDLTQAVTTAAKHLNGGERVDVERNAGSIAHNARQIAELSAQSRNK